MSTPIQRYYLQALQEEVLCRFDSRKPTLKTNISFEELSNDILSVTKIKISESHLKRFFGTVQYDDFFPSNHLDVLSEYVNFGNWEEFKKRLHNISIYEEVTPPIIKSSEPFTTIPFKFDQQQELYFIIVLLLILMIGLIILNG